MLPLARLIARARWLRLSVLGSLSVLVWWAGLIAPYSLFALTEAPLQTLATLTYGTALSQVRFVATLAVLFGLYGLAWWTCRTPLAHANQAAAANHKRQPAHPPSVRPFAALSPDWLALAGSLILIALSLVWLYPIGSTDLFDNIMQGRILAQWGGNPFYTSPLAYTSDPFLGYAGWLRTPFSYGPAWALLSAVASGIAGDGWLANVLAFKGVSLLFYGASVGVVAAILRRQAPQRALAGTCLFAWNPLVLYEAVGNGHNDIVMVFFVLAAVWMLTCGRHTWAAVALTAGALVKFIPALLVPIVLAYSLRRLPNRRACLRYVAATVAACGGLALVSYGLFWSGGDISAVARRSALFTTSLPALIQGELAIYIGIPASQYIISQFALVVTILMADVLALQVWTATAGAMERPSSVGDAWLAPVRAGAALLLFYLLVACLWFQPWYAMWPVALAALLPEGPLAFAAALLTVTAAGKPVVFDFFLSPVRATTSARWREAVLVLAVHVLPWLYSLYGLTRLLDLRRTAAYYLHLLRAGDGKANAHAITVYRAAEKSN